MNLWLKVDHDNATKEYYDDHDIDDDNDTRDDESDTNKVWRYVTDTDMNDDSRTIIDHDHKW